MYALYSLGLAVAFVLSLPFFLWKGRRSGKYVRTFRERMGRLPPELGAAGQGAIWVHAVSVGEVLAARPLVTALKGRFPARKIFLSTTTVTGNAVARNGAGGADGLFFAPFDFRRPVRKALAALDPALLVLVETELWPNLVHEARRRGTRVAIVNGRISPRSYPRYRWIRGFLRRVLADVDLCLMQGEAHAERIRTLGAIPERVRVLGNLKFDALDAPAASGSLATIAPPDGRPVWVAGSTVAGEEEIVLAAFQRIRKSLPDAALVIAPRRPERFGEIPALVEAAGLRCVRRTAWDAEAWNAGAVLLLDTIGELAQVYPMATVVFVGGSLMPAGGHNILEAAVAGKAVVVGPHMENFQEIADEFRSAGALVQIASADELAAATFSILTDAARRRSVGERARSLIDGNKGAVQGTVDALAGLIA